MQTAQDGSERVGRATNTGASLASDPSAFLEGLGDDPDLVAALRDFRWSIAEDLQIHTTPPMP